MSTAVPSNALIHADFAASFYWMNGAEVGLSDILDLGGATLGPRGILIESGKEPQLTVGAMSLLAGGLSQVVTWDADRCDNNRYSGPAIADSLSVGIADNGVFAYSQGLKLYVSTYSTDILLVASRPAWMGSTGPGVHKLGVTLFRPEGGRNGVDIAGAGLFAGMFSPTDFAGALPSIAAYFPFGTTGFEDSGGGTDPLYASALTIFPALSEFDMEAAVA